MPYIAREELWYVKNLATSEITRRTSLAFELIPGSLDEWNSRFSAFQTYILDDCWLKIFAMLSKNQDVSKIFRLRGVNKRWYNCVPSLSEALIERPVLKGYRSNYD